MALVPRNAPCPCGAGRKYKRCCIDRERELVRRNEALEELLALPSLFPLLRPADDSFERWAEQHAGAEPMRALIEEGGSLLPEAESVRIRRGHAREFPEVWESLVRDCADEREAEDAVLIGAVVAALQEERELDDGALELIEEVRDLQADPIEALAIAVDACNLWSLADATLADDALARIDPDLDDGAYEAVAEALLAERAAGAWTPTHERRLALLVGRVRARLPMQGRRRASRVLERACTAFDRDPDVRGRLAAMLLADTLGPLRLRRLYELVAT